MFNDTTDEVDQMFIDFQQSSFADEHETHMKKEADFVKLHL
jgi:hypothetical protein